MDDEKFRCRGLNEWRLTPCAKGENEHGCSADWCGIPCEGSTVGASGSASRHDAMPTEARTLEYERPRREERHEVALPRPTIEVPPPPPPSHRQDSEAVDLREVFLGSHDGVTVSVTLPTEFADRVRVPPSGLACAPHFDEALFSVLQRAEEEPPLLQEQPAHGRPSVEVDDPRFTVTNPGAPVIECSLSITGAPPPERTLANLDLAPLMEQADQLVQPPEPLTDFDDLADPFAAGPGGLP